MGSNMAEAHPVAFQWVMEAKKSGARVVHVDPRFTRTSALADSYVRIRAGTDIAFLGGVVNHVLSNDLHFREYVAAYTNAAFLVNEGFADTEDLDGLFSGYDPASDRPHDCGGPLRRHRPRPGQLRHHRLGLRGRRPAGDRPDGDRHGRAADR